MSDRESRSRKNRAFTIESLETRSLLSAGLATTTIRSEVVRSAPHAAFTATFAGTFTSGFKGVRGLNTELRTVSAKGTSTVPGVGTASLASPFTAVVVYRNGAALHVTGIRAGSGSLTLTKAVPGGQFLAGVSVNIRYSGKAAQATADTGLLRITGSYHVPYSTIVGRLTGTGTFTYKTATSGTFTVVFAFAPPD